MTNSTTSMFAALVVLAASGVSAAGADGAKSTMFLDPANESGPAVDRSTSEDCKALAAQLSSLERAPLRRSELQRRYEDECTGRRTTNGAAGSSSGNR